MNRFNLILAGLFVVTWLIIGSMCVYTVNETEKALEFQFGRIVTTDIGRGIHFKAPWNSIKKFDARVQTMDANPENFLTAEKKNVIVDSFVKWRIGDASLFYTVAAGDVGAANLRLDQIIKDAFRAEFSKRSIKQLVSTDRKEIRDLLVKNSKKQAAELGLEIIDVRVMRIDLPPEVSGSVFERMKAERTQAANKFRSQGAEQAEKIKADADRQRVVTLANSYRDAEILRGEGDATAAEIYAKAYGQDTEFFTFSRSLNAYKKTFSSSSTLVLDPDSDFFQYFKKQK